MANLYFSGDNLVKNNLKALEILTVLADKYRNIKVNNLLAQVLLSPDASSADQAMGLMRLILITKLETKDLKYKERLNGAIKIFSKFFTDKKLKHIKNTATKCQRQNFLNCSLLTP